jgi:hypothetical protein
MMGGSPTQQQHRRDRSEVLAHLDAQLAQSQQTLQTQISDCQDKIALPSGCMVAAAAGGSRD